MGDAAVAARRACERAGGSYHTRCSCCCGGVWTQAHALGVITSLTTSPPGASPEDRPGMPCSTKEQGARVCVALADVDDGKRERASPRRECDPWNSSR
jgi:hypothetical protein